mmetsp:Transcript_25580/g.29523  ORF Transcript_25580/g.29523 Transcript_25580/m.29523 type:complete len:84 (+) Transcript_25580:1650-1901(+)
MCTLGARFGLQRKARIGKQIHGSFVLGNKTNSVGIVVVEQHLAGHHLTFLIQGGQELGLVRHDGFVETSVDGSWKIMGVVLQA